MGEFVLIGKILNCVIHDINTESRTVSMKLDTNAMSESPVQNAHLPFLALSPGMLFDVVIDKIVEVIYFLSVFCYSCATYRCCSTCGIEWTAGQLSKLVPWSGGLELACQASLCRMERFY
jgi:hypothetical protein